MKRWFELRPYSAEQERNPMHDMMDHLPGFLLLAHRDEYSRIRILIRVQEILTASLDVVPGIEVRASGEPDMSRYDVYEQYALARHCAVPIADERTARRSIYRILDTQAADPAFLAMNAKMTNSKSRIYRYVQSLENGRPPEGIMGALSQFRAPRKSGAASAEKIRLAKSKAAKRHLFECDLISGAMSLQDLYAVRSVFPASAFAAKKISRSAVVKACSKTPSVPLIGASRHPLLSDTEILSFFGLPDGADTEANIEPGRERSHSRTPRASGISTDTM